MPAEPSADEVGIVVYALQKCFIQFSFYLQACDEIISIAFRVRGIKVSKLVRRFRKSDTVGGLLNFVYSQGWHHRRQSELQVFLSYPYTLFSSDILHRSLADAGCGGSGCVIDVTVDRPDSPDHHPAGAKDAPPSAAPNVAKTPSMR